MRVTAKNKKQNFQNVFHAVQTFYRTCYLIVFTLVCGAAHFVLLLVSHVFTYVQQYFQMKIRSIQPHLTCSKYGMLCMPIE